MRFLKRGNNSGNRGMTIIETIIGITLLAIIVGGILGTFAVIQLFFKDGIALVNAQATARIVTEKVMRPIRNGKSFTVSADGNTLTLTKYDGTVVTFIFSNGDGSDDTSTDNVIKKTENGVTTAIANIVKIPKADGTGNENIFSTIVADRVAGIKFGVRREGRNGRYKELRIDTCVKLRNEASLSK